MANPTNPRQTFAAAASRKWLTFPPAADALSQVKDGHPMDAGTWHIVQQNANVALDVAPRQLVTSATGGSTVITQPTSGGWVSLLEDLLGSAERTASITDIAWSTRENGGGPVTAEKHGPFPAVRDFVLSDGTAIYRRVRVQVWLQSSVASEFSVGVALTGGPSPPTEGYLYWSGWTANGLTTARALTFTVEPGTVARMTLPSGVATTVGGVGIVESYYLWVGFKHSGVGTHNVYSISAYEWIGDA